MLTPTMGNGGATAWYSSTAGTHDHSHWYTIAEPWKYDDNNSQWKTYSGTSWVEWDNKDARITQLEQTIKILWKMLKQQQYICRTKEADEIENLIAQFKDIEIEIEKEEEETKDKNPKHLEDKLFEL